MGIVLVGCSNDGDKDTEDSKADNNADTKTEKKDDKQDKKVYQIGETAVITSNIYDFDYQVTVNDFKLTREVDDTKIENFINGAIDKDRFAVVDVTIKNISDESYIPNEKFSANLAPKGRPGGDTSWDEFFKEGDKELKPKESLEGHLIYTTRVDEAKTFELLYEFMSDEETIFELPNPER